MLKDEEVHSAGGVEYHAPACDSLVHFAKSTLIRASKIACLLVTVRERTVVIPPTLVRSGQVSYLMEARFQVP